MEQKVLQAFEHWRQFNLRPPRAVVLSQAAYDGMLSSEHMREHDGVMLIFGVKVEVDEGAEQDVQLEPWTDL